MKLQLPLLALMTAFAAACSDDGGYQGAGSGGTDAGSGGTHAGVGGADAAQQLAPGPGEYRTDYQASDEFFTRMSAPASSGSVHGTVRIWYSSNVRDLSPAGPFTVPEGTVAIKEEYNSADEVFVKVVMIKQAAGYDPAHNDWYYEARNADDSLAGNPAPGTPSLCIGCHSASSSTDYLQGFALSN